MIYEVFLVKGSYSTVKHVMLRAFVAIVLRPRNGLYKNGGGKLEGQRAPWRLYRIGLMRLKGSTYREIAQRYGCHPANIRQILHILDRQIRSTNWKTARQPIKLGGTWEQTT